MRCRWIRLATSGALYRASLSGKLESAEAARLAFILKEVRASLECERELHLDAPQFAPVNFTILSVPPGSRNWSSRRTRNGRRSRNFAPVLLL
jgi:hypothetical protein